MTDDLREIFGEPIHTYTRAQALADGQLVDASTLAREAGLRWPTALTCAAWARCVALPADYQGCQDVTGRLWDVLNLARWAMRNASPGADRADFTVRVRRIRADATDAGTLDTVALYVHVGPGDDAAPVLTIMLDGED